MALQIFKINSNTLTATAANITFSNIPSGYTDLLAVMLYRSTAAGANSGGWTINFNGTTTGYTQKSIWSSGTTAGSDAQVAGNGLVSAGNTANTFASIQIYIPNYSNGTNAKSYSIDAVSENNTSATYSSVTAGISTVTAAISTLLIGGNNLDIGSSITLYGIK